MSRMIDVVGDLPATFLDPDDVITIRGCVDAGMYGEQESNAIRALLCGIHELEIEIYMCHQRMGEFRPACPTCGRTRSPLAATCRSCWRKGRGKPCGKAVVNKS